MDARKGNIYEILNGNKQFLIPVYQRFYSWDNEQCQKLWKDIVVMQKQNKSGHFVGSIVNIAEQAMPTGVQKYLIIDGQQRMTTLTLLLIALRNYSINNPNDTTINARRIDNMLLKNEYENDDERYKLLLTETDKVLLISLIENKPYDEQSNSRIIKNYNYFVGEIQKMTITPAEVYEAIGKLQIVNITLDRLIDDAQAIFESLNSTGKDLSQSDLIRNYILMGLDVDEQKYIYEHYWRPMELSFDYTKQESAMDSFFRDYLTMKRARIPKIDRVYEEFKSYRIVCGFSTLRELCKDLLKFAILYTDMIFCRHYDSEIRVLYEDIRSLKMEVSFPFLLKVLDDHNNGLINREELIEIIQLCISYVFRRSICDIPTNFLNKTFATLKNEIHSTNYLESIKAFFILRDDYKEFPTDEKFIKAFSTRDMYSMRNRNFVLSHLENFNNKSKIIIEKASIEHIIPQNLNLNQNWRKELGENWKEVQKTYLHTIGNLTLTAYNSEMGDKSFTEKLEMTGGFKESALRLNSYVIKQTVWNEDKIKERAGLLADKAIKIWKYPKLSESDLKKYTETKEDIPNYSIESYGMNENTLKLYEALDKRILNLSPSVKRELKKQYIAYKLDTNFVDIVIQKQRLSLTVNLKYSEVYDQNGICRDISNIGHWGNGDIEVSFSNITDIDQIMEIIKQSFDAQLN